MNRILSGSLAIAATLCLHSASAQSPYQVFDHWKIGGTGGWDYLLADPEAHRLYITHNSKVEVLDTDSGRPVGAIPGLKGTHGVALDDTGQFGYISDGGANAVVVFDRKSLATVATIPAGTNPDGITFDPATKTVWAFNGRSNNVTVIDAASRSVVATIALPGKPEFPQPDGQGHVYANIEDKNSIVAFDSRRKVLTATWKLKTCESPSGLAIDRAHGRLFAVCDGKQMAIVDTKTGEQVGTASIGDGPDAAAFDAKHQLAFASSGDGLLSVVDTVGGYKTIESLPTIKGGRTMAYDGASDRIYVVSAEMGTRPSPTASNPRPRAPIVPDTFQVLVIGRK